MSKMTRPQLVVAQLFYPAFLGNMTYEAANKLFADKLFNASANFDWMARFVVLALLAHFVLDWVYTVDEDSPPRPYSFAKGVFDTVMVLCLYVAVRLVLNLDTALFEPCPGLREPALWLLVAKLVAVGWELTEWAYLKKPAPWPRIKGCELGLDLGFAVLYLIPLFEVWGVSGRGVGFGLIVALDAAGYELHAWCKRKLLEQAKAPPAPPPARASVGASNGATNPAVPRAPDAPALVSASEAEPGTPVQAEVKPTGSHPG